MSNALNTQDLINKLVLSWQLWLYYEASEGSCNRVITYEISMDGGTGGEEVPGN